LVGGSNLAKHLGFKNPPPAPFINGLVIDGSKSTIVPFLRIIRDYALIA
jgi:hypothetical protein